MNSSGGKEKKVAQIMNDTVLSVPLDEPVMSILDRLIKNRIRRISVVENGQIGGRGLHVRHLLPPVQRVKEAIVS